MSDNFGVFQTAFGPRLFFADEWTDESRDFLVGSDIDAVEFDGPFGDLSFLKDCGDSIREMTLNNEDKIVGDVASLEGLESLFLKFLNKDDVDFCRLKRLKKLGFTWQSKRPSPSALNHPSIEFLRMDKFDGSVNAKSSSLKELFLYGMKHDDLRPIQGLSSLEKLTIEKSKALTSTQGLPGSVKDLTIRFCANAQDFSGLASLGSVQSIHLMNVHSLEKVPQEIYSLNTLQYLTLSGNSLAVNWADILSIESLEKVAIADVTSGPSDEEFSTLASRANKKITSIKRQGSKQPLICIDLLVE